ncbi:TDT family transporter [Promicromonospora sp. MS192]|uniref:TDT family transporter n=1 Tax=Promicromonospora sp. MS192 TaxID=3412684 RepID=UPI003C2ED63A
MAHALLPTPPVPTTGGGASEPATGSGTPGPPRRRRVLFRVLESPSDAVSAVTPNWFAAVMGTGIVANAAVTLPVQVPGLRAAATVVWGAATLLLLVLAGATVAHWVRFPAVARGHLLHPVTGHFYGAPAMALLTVGAGTLLVGTDVLGPAAALTVSAVLWTLGTCLGLVTAVLVPYLTFTRYDVADDAAFGGWLMPVVPPMVSAATGALLVPHVPAGQWRLTLLLACGGMFGTSLIASLVIITLVWSRLARHKTGPAATVPTLWILLGPLGQSVTAANLLGGVAYTVLGPHGSRAVELAAVLYGLPVLGFALLWAAVALAVTVRTARAGLPFGLTWWSFTFPVGTCVTGASALALHTGAVALQVLAVTLYVALLGAWGTVAARTFRGAVLDGTLLAPHRA